jgi:hypothetical protein
MEELKQVVTSYAEALENAVRFHYYLKRNNITLDLRLTIKGGL